MVVDELSGPAGVLARPDRPCGTGVLVLHGSSGLIDRPRAENLARHGALVCATRWFGDDGQPAGACEIPLETFSAALDRLRGDCDRLAVLGISYGAEAALLTAVQDQRVAAVVALAPTPVVWEGARLAGQVTPRSKWTAGGTPLPFVPHDREWSPDADPPAFRSFYAQSLRTYADHVAAATIPVERIAGPVVCVAGAADAVWDSVAHSRSIADRRAAHGLPTTVVTHPAAGHSMPLPGEPAPAPSRVLARGGDPRSDADLGAQAWPHIVEALRLTS